jgi:hypothetical protein
MLDEKDVQVAAIGFAGAILGAIIGGIGTYLGARSSNQVQERLAKENATLQRRAFLDGLILKMLEFLMDHPHLEKDDFCQKYPDLQCDKNGKERYESFCCFVFNLLAMVFDHFEGDGDKIKKYIYVGEIVRKHHRWWQHDRDNLEYDKPFRQFIQSVLDEQREKREIP